MLDLVMYIHQDNILADVMLLKHINSWCWHEINEAFVIIKETINYESANVCK